MSQRGRRKPTVRACMTALLALVVMLAAMPHAVLAQSNPDAGDGLINDTTLEFGVWWVEDYPPRGAGGSDLPATRPDALGLRDMLTSTCKLRFFGCLIQWNQQPPWTKRFEWGNANAWPSDWRSAAHGGSENSYIDTVDLAYFAGHGSKSGIYFYETGATATTLASKSQVVGAWGDRDLDWVGLAACNVLDDPFSNLQDWARAMNGVRLLMGFKTVMNDVPHGREFGQYIRDGYTFTQAWFKAADKLQSQNRVARILAEDIAHFDDRPAQHAATTVVDSTFYYWTHPVGSEPARFVNAAELGGVMPVLQVQPLSLDEAIERKNTLESAFGVTITLPPTESMAVGIQAIRENGGIGYSEDGSLEFDTEFGLFFHTDPTNLWVVDNSSTQMAAAGVPMMILTKEDAAQLANSFLAGAGLLPGDAQFYEVTQDSVATAEQVVTAAGETVVAVTNEEPTNYQVVYSRIISFTPSMMIAGASQQPVEISVMGPGSKLKVYVDTQVPAGLSVAALTDQAILGAMGGYRNIMDPVTAASTGALRTVPMLPEDVIRKLFNSELEADVALDHIPLPPGEIVSREIVTITPAYWEGPMGYNQDQLIPVYALEVNNILRDSDNTTYTVPSSTYIPVNPEYMAPLARISTTVDLDEPVEPGDVLVFEALDAAQTLAALGLDPDPDDGNPLNFNLGTDNGLFLYEWYANEISENTRLEPKEGSNGRILELVAANSLNVEDKEDALGTLRIILVVRDSLKTGEPNSSQASVTLRGQVPSILLPTIQSSGN